MASFKQNENTGYWYFVIDVGKDMITGKRKQKTISKDDKGRNFESERAARRYAVKVEEEIERGRKFDSVKFADYLKDYFEKVAVEKISEVTYNQQWMTTRLYIIPYLGHHKIDKINDEIIEKYYAKLLADGVSRAYIALIRIVLSKVFKHALKKRLIMENPMYLVTTPAYKPESKTVWTPEQIDHFLEVTKESKFYALYILAESTGMRRGEMLALEWDDIDFENARVTINKSLKYTKKKGLHISGPKTENSRRTITLPQYTIEVLKEHKKNQLEGVRIVFDNFGEYYSPGLVSDNFLRDCKRSNLPSSTLHGLRHAHASYLLSIGYSVADVAARLGDTKETVMKTYAHVLPNTQNEIAAALDRRKGVDKQSPIDQKSPEICE